MKQIEIAEILREIQEEINGLMGEAEELLRTVGGGIEARAANYWIPHIRSSAGLEGGNKYDISIATTLDELELEGEEDDDC